MANSSTRTMWWLKSNSKQKTPPSNESVARNRSDDISSSLAEFLEKERDLNNIISDADVDDVDIGSIIEEINRISVKSSLGPLIQEDVDRSIEDILKEAQQIYLETSKSFDQLSQRSRTSQNLTDVFSSVKTDESTPTPKSISPLPFDDVQEVKTPVLDNNSLDKSIPSIYSPRNLLSEAYKENLETPSIDVARITPNKQSTKQPFKEHNENVSNNEDNYSLDFNTNSTENNLKNNNDVPKLDLTEQQSVIEVVKKVETNDSVDVLNLRKELAEKDERIQNLVDDNDRCKDDISSIEKQIQEYQEMLKTAAMTFKNQNQRIYENSDTARTIEDLKDIQEVNMSLQLQLNKVNDSHQILKQSHDEVMFMNKKLENRIMDMDSTLLKYKEDYLALQSQTQKLSHKEVELMDQLQAERVQVKTFQNQIEKDAKCIMDLNRQIKEMERIISRKQPDSVSSLIVCKNDTDFTTKKVLEDRIKILEAESNLRNEQNSKVFLDVQDKFNQMKHKYESHIEDLELHVADLKSQMKNRIDTYDVYTQTITMKKIDNPPIKDSRLATKKVDNNKDAHLVATIRGLQADLLNKDKTMAKIQKELDDLKKTNRRLQKEREGSLKNLCVKQDGGKKEVSPQEVGQNDVGQSDLLEKIKELKIEKDRMHKQLCKIDDDFQKLKRKRIEDLTKLQEAHELEISGYLANITPLREQLDIQQISLNTLQSQLASAKEELSVISVERDLLNNKLQLQNSTALVARKMDLNNGEEVTEVNHLRKKMSSMEFMYSEREDRLRAIIHGLAQKNIMNRNCDQCANRQQQLIGYKTELDQLIATLRCLQ